MTGLSGKPEKLYSDGLHIAGERYVLTKAEDRSLYARKVGHLAYASATVYRLPFLWDRVFRWPVVYAVGGALGKLGLTGCTQ